MLKVFFWVGNFAVHLTSHLFHKFISEVVSATLLYDMYVWWMVGGWMAWSGLLVLVVKCVGKFSLPGGGFLILVLHYIGGILYTSG